LARSFHQIASYRHWQDQFGRSDFTFGPFGENFTVEGLSDDKMCIGDRYRIGAGLFEVTQPPSPAAGRHSDERAADGCSFSIVGVTEDDWSEHIGNLQQRSYCNFPTFCAAEYSTITPQGFLVARRQFASI
jgi:hypothetical protein